MSSNSYEARRKKEEADRNWELDRNTIVDDRKWLVFVLSYVASSLLLVTGLLTEGQVALIFLSVLIVVLSAVIVLVRRPVFNRWVGRESSLLQTRWGTLAVATLGFGLGTLIHNRRAWFHWLWSQFRRIDTSEEWVLVSLFLLGVMLGFFVVRNWSKTQQEFMASITAALGAAFLATFVGSLAGNQQAVTPPQQTVTTELSTGAAPTPAPPATPPATGGAAGAPTPTPDAPAGARPATTPAPATVRTTATTGPANSSQSNTLAPVRTFATYALGFALSGVLNLIAFSLLVASYSRTQSRRSRSIIEFLYGSDRAQVIDSYFLKNFEADPNYAKAKLEGALTAYREIIRVEFARKLDRRKDLPAVPPPARQLDYFELVSIRSVESEESPPLPATKDTYDVMFRCIRKRDGGKGGDAITPEMLRVAISMRWNDNLEYIVAPGEYRQSFPYYGSVAGLSLLARRTIVMNRDRHRRFRTSNYVDGKTPDQADQPRGLYDIDYLSYVSVPMMSSFGKPEEQSLGVLHIDTKLFACTKEKAKKLIDEACRLDDGESGQEIYIVRKEVDKGKRLEEFEDYASNIYEENDPIIEDLERLRDVIIPLLELYKKCRTGALNQTTTKTTTTTNAAP